MFLDWPTWLLDVGLLGLMFAADEAGYRFGLRHDRDESESSRAVSGMLKGSVFGLVALLLGFSFSGTASRHDMRKKLVLDEANAVGTCHLRAGLLEEGTRLRIREILRNYVGVRIEHFEKGLDPAEVARTGREMDQQLAALWAAVEQANRQNPQSVLTSQIVPAANQVIDLSSTRAWAARNHLPAPILILLVACVIVSSVLIGHSSGQIAKRHAGLWLATNVLLAMVLYVVLDLDRPRRGLVQVDHTPLIELSKSLDQ